MQAALHEPAQAQFIDVREPAEYHAERLDGFTLMPLSRLDDAAAALNPEVPVYILCRSGSRARQAATRLQRLGFRTLFVIDGGITACAGAGVSVTKSDRRVWPLDRQVRLVAGLLVLTGVLLGWLVTPAFYGLAGFVGAGLTFAGLTDTCGMAMLLARMPWNRIAGRVTTCSPS